MCGMSLREREWLGGAWLGLSGWLSMLVMPLKKVRIEVIVYVCEWGCPCGVCH